MKTHVNKKYLQEERMAGYVSSSEVAFKTSSMPVSVPLTKVNQLRLTLAFMGTQKGARTYIFAWSRLRRRT